MKSSNMSRIGKQIIKIPEGVTFNVNGLEITAKGPKGELTEVVTDRVVVEVNEAEGIIAVTPVDKALDSAIWGTTRANIANMIQGVSEGWTRALELHGVGFKMEVKGKKVVMRLGFSHMIEYDIPEGIDASIEGNVLTISGISKQLVGQVAAEIRGFKKPEPYKGKGFRYTDEIVRRKAGKASKTD